MSKKKTIFGVFSFLIMILLNILVCTKYQRFDGGTVAARFIFCVLIDLMFLFVFWKQKWFIEFGKNIIHNKKLIVSLAKNDFKTKFAGSYLGIFWAFVQPIVTVLLYWFVFEKGLKAGGVRTSAGLDVPFVLWLIAGLVPWFYFQDALNGVTNSLLEYSYLVKKVVFDISILPVVKMISAIFVHAFFVLFMLVLYCALGFFPSAYAIQIFYYTFCVFALVLGLGYATCAIVIFFRDLTQIINIMLQIGTWMTPIMWNFDAIELHPALKMIFKLNPMYYVVRGYREALIDHVWFWQNTGLTIYFWLIVLGCFGLGFFMFRRLRVHFADVL